MDLVELQRELQELEGHSGLAVPTLSQSVVARPTSGGGLSESRTTPTRGGRKESMNHAEAAAAVAAAAQRLQLWQQQSQKVESRVAAMQRKQQAEDEAATRRLRFDHAMRSQAENAARHTRALQNFAAAVDPSYTASRAGSANVSFGRGVSASPSAALSEFVLDELGLPRDVTTGDISVAHVQQSPVYGGPLMLRRQGGAANTSAGSSGEVTTPLFFVPGQTPLPTMSSGVGFLNSTNIAAGSPLQGVAASGLFDAASTEGHSPNPRVASSITVGPRATGLPAPASVASGSRMPLRHRAHQLDPHTQRRVADAWRDTIVGLQGHLADVSTVNATQASAHHNRFIRSAATPEPSSGGMFGLTGVEGAVGSSAVASAAPPPGRPASYTPGPGGAHVPGDRPPMHQTWNGRAAANPNAAERAGHHALSAQQLQLDAALEVKATRRLVELMRREEAERDRRGMIRAGAVAPDDTLRAVDVPECGVAVVGDAPNVPRIEPLGVVTTRTVPTEELRTQVVAAVSEAVQPVLPTAAANDRRAYANALQAIRGGDGGATDNGTATAENGLRSESSGSAGAATAATHGVPGAATNGLDAAVAIARDSRLALRRAAQRREVEALRQQIAELEEEVQMGSAVALLQRVGRGARVRMHRIPALLAAANRRAAAAAAGEREEVASLLATMVNAQSSAAAAAAPTPAAAVTPPGTPSVGTSCTVSEADDGTAARAGVRAAAERVRRVSLLDMDDGTASTTTPATSETASPSRRSRTPVPLAPTSARALQEAAAQQMRAEADATVIEAQRTVAATTASTTTTPTLSQLLELRARLQQLVDGNIAERQVGDRAVDGGILAPLEAALEEVQSAIIRMLEARKAVGADLLRTLQREARESRHVARAARQVQAFFRMVYQRARYRVLLRDERERVAALSALAVLQRHQGVAATRIQAAWRGHCARVVAACRRHVKNRYGPRRCMADAASSAIAWAYRRYVLRDAPHREDPICAVQELQAATVLIQARWRGAVARAQFRGLVGGDVDAWRAEAHRRGAASVIGNAWQARVARKVAAADVSVRRVEATRRQSESLIQLAQHQIVNGSRSMEPVGKSNQSRPPKPDVPAPPHAPTSPLVPSNKSPVKLVRRTGAVQAPAAADIAPPATSPILLPSDAEAAVAAAELNEAARIIQRGEKARQARRELEALRVQAAVTGQRREAATTVRKAIDSARSQVESVLSARKELASNAARTASARAATRRAGASTVVAKVVEAAALASARAAQGASGAGGAADSTGTREDDAARVIQRTMRRAGLQSRPPTASGEVEAWRRDVVREEAVVQIQAAWRGARTRAEAAAALEERERDTAHVIADEAATMIQSAARGYLVRRDL